MKTWFQIEQERREAEAKAERAKWDRLNAAVASWNAGDRSPAVRSILVEHDALRWYGSKIPGQSRYEVSQKGERLGLKP